MTQYGSLNKQKTYPSANARTSTSPVMILNNVGYVCYTWAPSGVPKNATTAEVLKVTNVSVSLL